MTLGASPSNPIGAATGTAAIAAENKSVFDNFLNGHKGGECGFDSYRLIVNAESGYSVLLTDSRPENSHLIWMYHFEADGRPPASVQRMLKDEDRQVESITFENAPLPWQSIIDALKTSPWSASELVLVQNELDALALDDGSAPERPKGPTSKRSDIETRTHRSLALMADTFRELLGASAPVADLEAKSRCSVNWETACLSLGSDVLVFGRLDDPTARPAKIEQSLRDALNGRTIEQVMRIQWGITEYIVVGLDGGASNSAYVSHGQPIDGATLSRVALVEASEIDFNS